MAITRKKERFWINFCSSSMGGLLTALTMTPFDVVKIRQQMQTKTLLPGNRFFYHDGLMDHLCSCTNGSHVHSNGNCMLNIWYKRPSKFAGTSDAFRQIVRNEGILSLWSGFSPTLLVSIPSVAVYYSTYDIIKQCLGYHENPESNVIPLVSSLTARTIVTTVVNPVEVIRTKMQAERFSWYQIGGLVRTSILEKSGSSLMLGVRATLLRDLPFSGIYWVIVEWIRRNMSIYFHVDKYSVTTSITAGAIGGSIAGILTLPCDVIKTIMQTELGNSVPKYSSVSQLAMETWRSQGMRGLFAGWVPRLLKIVPACSIMLPCYESFKKMLCNYF